MSLPQLLIMGDSISVHYGPFLKERLAHTFEVRSMGDMLDALANLDVPRGANIGDSNNATKIIRTLCENGKMTGDVLLLNCGLHDVRRDIVTQGLQVPLEVYRANLEKIVGLMKSQKTRLIWVRTTPCDEAVHNKRATGFHRYAGDVEEYNAAADKVMNAAGVPMIDLHRFTLGLKLGQAVYSDHVHFPEAVRKQQADFIGGKVGELCESVKA